MKKSNVAIQVVDALNVVVNECFMQCCASTDQPTFPEADRASEAARKFSATLNESQKAAYLELESLLSSAEVASMRYMHKVGFYEGLAAGRAF